MQCYNHSTKFKKMLQMIIMRAQCPCLVQLGSLFPIIIEHFQNVSQIFYINLWFFYKTSVPPRDMNAQGKRFCIQKTVKNWEMLSMVHKLFTYIHKYITHTYINIYLYTHRYIHIYIHLNIIYTDIHKQIYTHTYIYNNTHIHTYIYT